MTEWLLSPSVKELKRISIKGDENGANILCFGWFEGDNAWRCMNRVLSPILTNS